MQRATIKEMRHVDEGESMLANVLQSLDLVPLEPLRHGVFLL